MKKKLEAELISIAHRILKLKNRADIDQLQAETLRLYEKLSVLKFVEDNFADVKPTIGYSSAEGKLEEIYGIEETPEVKANEVEAAEDKAREEKDTKKAKGKGKQEKENESAKEEKPEGDADPEQEVEEYQASEEEKEETEESGEQAVEEETKDEPAAKAEETSEEANQEETEDKEEETEEPEHKIEVVKPEEDIKAMEEGAAAVFEKEDDSTPEEEEHAADAEVITIEPDAEAEVEEGHDVAFAFERKPAPEEPAKQKEISFEDFQDYKEPEFVKKEDNTTQDDAVKEEAPAKEEEAPKAADDDWRNWEPSKSAKTEQEEPKKEEQPKAEEPKESAVKGNFASREGDMPKSLNDAIGKTISLGLNDRIAFEKHLFGGSGEDLNRVLSQLNTLNSFEEAKNFIDDLVKPDYNEWKGKEEYEERFMALVEKKFE